ncbi:hypothetical protein [Catenuloplanes atrovinosus]|uniref:Peptidase inhibitor family I36 n=1 Tax=Catenuloplanes atrovinosus TaxID=137266 RepID=A0AAE3YW48_9ACTN|nr:hypothetical protein [Catenuloplanes atrovinosus]MDR7279081.1 hypothetical protein [Catenuloplanes atrovinosus]
MTRSMGETTTRWMAAVAAAIVLVTGLIVTAASPASAAGADKAGFAGVSTTAVTAAAVGNCPRGYHCVYILDSFSSASHNYFNTDRDFSDDYFDRDNGNGAESDSVVDNNVRSAANSSSGGYESHFFYGSNPVVGVSTLVFCLNPNTQARGLWTDGTPGNGTGHGDEASSLLLRGRTSIDCLG